MISGESLQALGAFFALASAWLITAGVRRYSLASGRLLDQPSGRSSHSAATPRGGGIAIVVSFVVLTAWLTRTTRLPPTLGGALLGSGLLVAMAGFLDDHRPLPARWRFLAHFAAAVGGLWCIHAIPPVPIFGVSVDLGWFGIALAAAYIIWMVNLYNFMDGIDGIAGVEAITACLGGALCWWLATATQHWFVPVALACSVAGFLAWNFPPAKIFMGDAGSGFIGVVLGVLSLWSAQTATQVFWCWFILLGCFMVDATTTLIRRVRRGERFNEAHRSHAYQHAARKHGSHRAVTLACGLINIVWLLPLAALVAMRKLDGVAGVIVAYAPLVWLAFHYKAGAADEQGALR